MTRFLLDASVLIDLHLAGLLPKLPLLGQDFCTLDLVLAEIRSVSPEDVSSCGIECLELSGEELGAVVEARKKFARISNADAAALVAARGAGVRLLTGDLALRKAAEASGVEVHGTLWLFRRFVRAGVITEKQARDLLGELRTGGRRIPPVPPGYFSP